MNDESLNKTEMTTEGSKGLSVKKHRGVFFSAEVEKEVSSFKAESSNQTNTVAECERVEFVEIHRLFNEAPKLMAWIQPFIEIAERRAVNWEDALGKAMASVSAERVVTECRVYE